MPKNNNNDSPESTEQIEIVPPIKGSETQAFIIDVSLTHLGRALYPILNPVLAKMSGLNAFLQGLLAASTVVMTVLAPIPMSHAVSKHGGKKQVLGLLTGALVGMTALTTLSAVTDITAINSFGWEYGVILGSGLLMGCGPSVYSLILNALQWAKKPQHISIIQSSYGGIADFAGVLTPIGVLYLGSYGYYIPFAFYTGLLACSLPMAFLFIQPPPYLQLYKHVSATRARELAILHGQLPFMIHDEKEDSMPTVLRRQFETLFTYQGMVLNFAFFMALGGLLATETILPTLLRNGFNASQTEAVFIASGANFVGILARSPTSLLINKIANYTDYIHLLGTSLTATGMGLLAFDGGSPVSLYGGMLLSGIGNSIAIVTTTNLAITLSEPKNSLLKKYNPNTMMGLIGVAGTAGGVALPIVSGLMIQANKEEGYKNYFLLIMALVFFSGFLICLLNRVAEHRKGESIFGGSMNFFHRVANRARNLPLTRHYIFRDNPDNSSALKK